MDDLIKEYIKIIMDLLLVSLLLTVIVIFNTMSHSVANDMELQREAVNQIEEYSKVYPYDNKEVVGSDIAEAIIKFARYYNFEIVIDGINYKIDSDTEKTLGSKIWTEEYIVNSVLKSDVVSKFEATLIKDNYGYISGIKFVKK